MRGMFIQNIVCGVLASTLLTALSACHSTAPEACTNDPIEPVDMGLLKTDLRAYSAGYVTKGSPELRGFWSNLWRGVAVVASDAVGGAVGTATSSPVGGVMLGAAASVECAKALFSDSEARAIGPQSAQVIGSLTSYVNPAAVETTLPAPEGWDSTFAPYGNTYSVDVNSSDIAHMHNLVVHRYAEDSASHSSLPDKQSTVVSLREITDAVYVEESHPLQDLQGNRPDDVAVGKEASRICEKLVTALQDTDPYDALTVAMSELLGCSKTEAEILADYLFTLKNIDKSKSKEYTSGYQDLIFRSNASEDFKYKSAIFTAVAQGSNELWIVK